MVFLSSDSKIESLGFSGKDKMLGYFADEARKIPQQIQITQNFLKKIVLN